MLRDEVPIIVSFMDETNKTNLKKQFGTILYRKNQDLPPCQKNP